MSPIRALAAEIELLVVPGVFTDTSGGTGAGSLVSPEFARVMSPEFTRTAVAHLVSSSKVKFGNLTTEINSNNRLRTIALSLQVVRATRANVDKPDETRDIYLPVSISIHLSNPNTGEVLQGFSKTMYSVFTVRKDETAQSVNAKIEAAYRDGLLKAIDAVLSEARAGFSPYLIETKVKKLWNGFVILDGSSREGLGPGDLLESPDGNEIRVEYAADNYAVAIPVIGNPTSGEKFSRPSLMKLSDVRKPRVLTLVGEPNNEVPPAVLTQLFVDGLGTNAPFAVLPLNPNFSRLQEALERNSKAPTEIVGHRALPDYFIRLVAPAATAYEFTTNLNYKSERTYTSWVFAELVTADGSVLFASDSKHRMKEFVSHGNAFSSEEQRLVAMKNALHELAAKFTAGVKFVPATLPILTGNSNGVFQFEDIGGLLREGQSVRVFRSTQGQSAEPSGDSIWIPVWEARVATRNGSRVNLVPVLSVYSSIGAPAKGDVIRLNGISSKSTSGNRVEYCPAEKPSIGGISIEDFQQIGYAAVAASSMNSVNRRIPSLVRAKVGGHSGFPADLDIKPAEPAACIAALNRIDASETVCETKHCQIEYSVRTAIRIGDESNPSQQKVLEQTFLTSGFPAATQESVRDKLSQDELKTITRELLSETIRKLN